MDPRLEKLHNWLFENSPLYFGMVAIGSDATGDTNIEGRSEHSAAILFTGDFTGELFRIKKYFADFGFGDDYFFTPYRKDDFVRNHRNADDFERRFRSKTLFGEDLVSQVLLPDMPATREIYLAGLREFYDHLSVRLLNGMFWSEAKMRDAYWRYAKDAFASLAIKSYYDTRVYPRTRDDLIRALGDPVPAEALELFKEINAADKEKIDTVSQMFLSYAGTMMY